MRASLRIGLAAALSVVPAWGCASGPERGAFDNRVFYQYDTLNPAQAKKSLETSYAPLDKAESPALPQYAGVSVMAGAVRLSRPQDWVIRAGSLQPEHRYIEYVSPNQYVVAVYELVESPKGSWHDALDRYETAAKNAGAELLGKEIPMATDNAQGRGYLVRRSVAAAKGPLINYSNEYVLRGEHRVVLLQIVHHGESLGPLSAELRRVVETLQVN